MELFTVEDHEAAVAAMLAHPDRDDRQLRGLLSGIKRRARARSVIAFVQSLKPSPPDRTIATTRELMLALFGRAVSVNDLHRHFSTPGRKADDRADPVAISAWLEQNRGRLLQEASQLMCDLQDAWKVFTQAAAEEAGRLRKIDAARRQPAAKRQPHQGTP